MDIIEPQVIESALQQLNAPKDETPEEIEAKIELLENSRINLKVPNHVYTAIERQSEFKNLSIEEYCIQTLTEALETKIGTPWITGPSTFGKTPVVKTKISSPTYQVERNWCQLITLMVKALPLLPNT